MRDFRRRGAVAFAVVRGRDRNVGRRRGYSYRCSHGDWLRFFVYELRRSWRGILLRFKLIERGARGGGKGHKMLILH